MFDTLLEQHKDTPEQIIAIVNHELGHVAHKHIIRSMAIISVYLFILFSLFILSLDN